MGLTPCLASLLFVVAAASLQCLASPFPPCALLSPLIKVRPHDVPPALLLPSKQPPYALSSAANEYESVQVICLGPLANISLEVTIAPPIAFLLHSTLNVVALNASDCKGGAGAWPDPLVPAVDPFFHERRIFTTAVPQSQTRGWWVDFFVPTGTSPGALQGSVRVSAAGFAAPLLLPLVLRVRALELPQTSPRSTLFNACSSYPVNGSALNAAQLATQLADLGLMHRVTLPATFDASPELTQRDPPDLQGFWAHWGSLLLGRATPFGLANTTFAGAAQLPSPWCSAFSGASACAPGAAARTAALWSAMAASFAARGLGGLLYDYTYDEPQWRQNASAAWEEIRARAAVVHGAAPWLRVLVTTALPYAREGNVSQDIDLWSPLINDLDVKTRCSPVGEGSQRSAYSNVTRANLLAYQDCASHGCTGGCAELEKAEASESVGCHLGWVSYMIDHSLVANRAQAWVTYLQDLGGELYWGVNWAQCTGGDEWAPGGQYAAGGNGDGTLTYRGQPWRVGGSTEVPIASIRLKAIRDGQEDLLYMLAAEERVGRGRVLGVVGSVVGAAYAFAEDAALFAAAREVLGDLAEGRP